MSRPIMQLETARSRLFVDAVVDMSPKLSQHSRMTGCFENIYEFFSEFTNMLMIFLFHVFKLRAGQIGANLVDLGKM